MGVSLVCPAPISQFSVPIRHTCPELGFDWVLKSLGFSFFLDEKLFYFKFKFTVCFKLFILCWDIV